MRIIHQAALVFMLKDIYSKTPVTNAVILCDGKQNPYTRKDDGYYVFSDLYPKEYDISIRCKGYAPLDFPVKLRENETLVIHKNMSYSADNENLRNVTRFFIYLNIISPPICLPWQ